MTHVDTHPINVLSLCAGGGCLELGLRLAVPTARTVCWVEWEAYACSVLASRMEEEAVDAAPIWSDLRTFDGRPWRGVVDIVSAGFPCQPFSVAGKQAGTDDPRHLWPNVLRVLVETDAPFGFFENVAGLVHLGGLSLIRDDLERAGYGLVACPWSSSIVGNSHRRERVFMLAYRKKRGLGIGGQPSGGSGLTDGGNDALEHAQCAEPGRGDGGIEGDTARIGRGGLADASGTVADANGGPSGQGNVRAERYPVETSEASGEYGIGMADSQEPRRQGPEPEGHERPDGRPGEHDGDIPLFAPGPGELDRWRELIARHPELAPAIESGIRRAFDELAPQLVDRADRLRLLGNGVDPLVAATAALHLFALVLEKTD